VETDGEWACQQNKPHEPRRGVAGALLTRHDEKPCHAADLAEKQTKKVEVSPKSRITAGIQCLLESEKPGSKHAHCSSGDPADNGGGKGHRKETLAERRRGFASNGDESDQGAECSGNQ